MCIKVTRRGVKWAAAVSVGLAVEVARFGAEAAVVSAAGPRCVRYGPVKANYEPAGGFSTTHRLTVRGESPA